jgi:hypothetical protein
MVMRLNEPTIRGFKTSLNTRMRSAERELKVRPKSAQAELLMLKILHTKEMLELYIGEYDEG